MYQNAIEQVKGSQQQQTIVVRLAEVSSVSGGRAKVKFVGDENASQKDFPYMVGYNPSVGDKVVLLAQGMTYIIAGKYSNDAPVSGEYYVLKKDADTLYLTKGTADTLYAALEHSHNQLVSGTTTLTLSASELKPSTNEGVSLGDASKKFNEIYAKEYKGTKTATDKTASTYLSGKYVADVDANSPKGVQLGNINSVLYLYPLANESVGLGASSYRFRDFFAKEVSTDSLTGKWSLNHSAYHNLYWPNQTTVAPYYNADIDLGTSSRELNNVYAKQFYQNGTAISTSDKNKKKDIKDLAEKYIEFFKKLRPVSFKFKKKWSDSGRTHTGFIAQEVETAAEEAGIDSVDLAFLCKDPDGNYGLRYDELIAIQTAIIQDLVKRVEALERRNNDLTV